MGSDSTGIFDVSEWLREVSISGSGPEGVCFFCLITEQVKSSHFYLYSAFNNAHFVKTALHQLDLKLGGFTSALQYLDGKILCQNTFILLWP